MGDPPAPRETNVVVDDARVVPVTKGAAHALRNVPEGAAPQDAGRIFRGRTRSSRFARLHVLRDRDSHPPGSASIPRRYHSILPHHRGWHRAESIPRLLY